MGKETVKPTARNWSSKFWHTNPIKNVLAEIIKPEEIDMSTVKTNDELNPILWDGEELKPDIRAKLLKIASEFIKYCKIEDKKFQDILLVGSNANYNYTQFSDVDLHILMDFNEIDADPEIVGEYFKAKKELWSLEHEILIDDHTVECFVQNSSEPFTSMGVFSLMKNEWVRKPIKKFINVDEADVQLKAADIMNKIDILVDEFNKGMDVTQKAKLVKDKIKKMRQAGLYKEGEFSPENLTFKILRNTGYMDKLNNLKNDSFDRALSSGEPKEDSVVAESKKYVINEFQFKALLERKYLKEKI
jgi:hypothetical protein